MGDALLRHLLGSKLSWAISGVVQTPLWGGTGECKTPACEWGMSLRKLVRSMQTLCACISSGTQWLRLTQNKQREPVRVLLPGHQFTRTLVLATDSAAHEAPVIQSAQRLRMNTRWFRKNCRYRFQINDLKSPAPGLNQSDVPQV